MTHEEKISYMKVATNIVGFGFLPKDLDMLVSIYDLVLENKGETDLQSITDVKAGVDERHTSMIEEIKQQLKG